MSVNLNSQIVLLKEMIYYLENVLLPYIQENIYNVDPSYYPGQVYNLYDSSTYTYTPDQYVNQINNDISSLYSLYPGIYYPQPTFTGITNTSAYQTYDNL